MTQIHQEVIVRSSVTCAVWDCHASLSVDAVVDGAVDDVYSGKVMIGVARSDSTTGLFSSAKEQGWMIGAHDNVCPVHVGAAIYEYMQRVREQQERIRELHTS